MLTTSTINCKVTAVMAKNESEYHHKNLRQKLLKETRKIISESGAEKVTLRYLAERAGVSRTAPYRHFADKFSLLAAAAEEGYLEMINHIRRKMNEKKISAESDIKSGFEAYIDYAVKNPANYQLMFGKKIIKKENYPDTAKAAEELFKLLLAVVETSQSKKLIKSGPPPKTAHMMWAFAHGLALSIIENRVRVYSDIQEMTDDGWEILFNGIRNF